MSTQANDKKKWKLVEKIVAAAFDEPNVQVQTNVRLRSIRRKGGAGGLREIDVLITGELVGQKVYFPIECKDYKRKVDSSAIDEFIGKLQDVGMATQTSIFVTTRGYTTPAIERAHEVGMKTLVLKDNGSLSDKNQLLHALQSHIFIGCAIREVSFASDNLIVEPEKFQFFDKDSNYIGLLPDFLWESWLRGSPPAILGQYSYNLKVLDDFNYLENGTANDIRNIKIKFEVFAVAFQFTGEASSYHLVNSMNGTTDRFKLSADFSSSIPRLTFFQSEESLINSLNEESAIAKITFPRTKLPKIVMNQGMLWPMSPAMLEHLKNIQPQNIEQEFMLLVEAGKNNFWNFDPSYSEIIKNIGQLSHQRFEMEPIEE